MALLRQSCCLAAFGAFGLAAISPAEAQVDSSRRSELAPGVVHRRLVVNGGPWRIHVVEVDLRRPEIHLIGVRALDKLRGRETVSSMVHRYAGTGSVIAAVNGDFFHVATGTGEDRTLGTGESENNVMIEGALLKGVKLTDSPYDSFNNAHSQFALDSAGHPFIERFSYSGTVIDAKRRIWDVDAVNHWSDSSALVLYTRYYGDSTASDSVGRHTWSIQLRPTGTRGDTLLFRTAGAMRKTGSAASLSTGAALVAGGARKGDLERIVNSGAKIRVVNRLSPFRPALRTVIGGWPRLIVNGRSVAGVAQIVEGTSRGFTLVRHPRTAVGFSRDSSTLYLVTVDGRSESNAGMTLPELATAMLQLGVYNAMNFDGGGSTTMVLSGTVVNSPSDKAGERPVGSALFVIR